MYQVTDGSTTLLSYGLNRVGQIATVTMGTNQTTVSYDELGRITGESYIAGTLNGLSVSNFFNSVGLRTTSSFNYGTNVLGTNAFTYDNASRLTNVINMDVSAGYSYLANSPLVGQITFRTNSSVKMTTTKQFDKLNRLQSISSQGATDSPASLFSYIYNNANQRIRTSLTDGSFWLYTYDKLGQVVSGKRYWSDGTPVAGQQNEYAFDDIGNRTSTKSGGDQTGGALQPASYNRNLLNQYTSRTVPAVVDVLGVANTNVTVAGINAQFRRGDYFWHALTVGNSSSFVLTNVVVSSWGTNVSGNMYQSKANQAFTYDSDGNLLTDGRWTYGWDNENRLVTMTDSSSLAAVTQRNHRFTYDWKGRRIRKTVTDGNSLVIQDVKFIYDGWNLLAELNASDNALIRSYVWGLDLSGSMQGAGGVGGLLAVRDASTGVHFAVFDGNGNVAGLVGAADGKWTARYEYGPFGENIRATGPMAKRNSFRFSTKYQDDETGLLYYGYRYYDTSSGRWLSRDPIGEKGGRNVYAFISGNSVNDYDKDGRYAVQNIPIGLGFSCSCKCLSASVKYSPGVDDFKWGWFPEGNEHMRYGNDISITWKVSGNPYACSITHQEDGITTFKRDNPNKQHTLSKSGETLVVANTTAARMDSAKLGIVLPVVNYGSDSINYIDGLGGRFFTHPEDDGLWRVDMDLTMTLKCKSTDGNVVPYILKIPNDSSIFNF